MKLLSWWQVKAKKEKIMKHVSHKRWSGEEIETLNADIGLYRGGEITELALRAKYRERSLTAIIRKVWELENASKFTAKQVVAITSGYKNGHSKIPPVFKKIYERLNQIQTNRDDIEFILFGNKAAFKPEQVRQLENAVNIQKRIQVEIEVAGGEISVRYLTTTVNR